MTDVATAEGGGWRRDVAGLETEATRAPSGWFAKLVSFYLRYRRTKPAVAQDDATARERAISATRIACLQSAATGATAGLATTGATIFTAETEGVGAIVALPVAVVSIGSEMALRALIHIDLICTIADVFGVPLAADKPDDLYRLCALAFGTKEQDEESSDPGKALVSQLVEAEREEVGEELGHKIIGESVLRNVVPVIGIASSAISNWRRTKSIGDTARRYMRYRRALGDALARAKSDNQNHFELLVEGFWFVFIADGRLVAEESACLASLVEQLDDDACKRVLGRFVEDEFEWLERLPQIDEASRPAFFNALEVAAAVDKKAGLPERRLLRSAARRLGLVFEPDRVERMMSELDETGVLSAPELASRVT